MNRVDSAMYQEKSVKYVAPMAIAFFFVLWKDARPGDALLGIVVATKVKIMTPL
jgi:hypothetical protein